VPAKIFFPLYAPKEEDSYKKTNPSIMRKGLQ
jgi:hypothetical protein